MSVKLVILYIVVFNINMVGFDHLNFKYLNTNSMMLV